MILERSLGLGCEEPAKEFGGHCRVSGEARKPCVLERSLGILEELEWQTPGFWRRGLCQVVRLG